MEKCVRNFRTFTVVCTYRGIFEKRIELYGNIFKNVTYSKKGFHFSARNDIYFPNENTKLRVSSSKVDDWTCPNNISSIFIPQLFFVLKTLAAFFKTITGVSEWTTIEDRKKI